jgi:hypothetical protein
MSAPKTDTLVTPDPWRHPPRCTVCPIGCGIEGGRPCPLCHAVPDFALQAAAADGPAPDPFE